MDAIYLPVYILTHGGSTVATTPFHCRWDSGLLGFAYVTRQEARKHWGWKRITKEREETVLRAIKGEVETYDTYIRGEVYGYIIKDKEGNQLDSCWEIYGMENCIEQATEDSHSERVEFA